MQFIKQMEKNNVSIDSLSQRLRDEITEYQQFETSVNKEREKANLKKINPSKYELFWGKAP
jgi:hypothetical protein